MDASPSAGPARPVVRGLGPPGRAGEAGELLLLVLGESRTAKGEPYDPYISVGQIVAWQLERALPGRSVKVEIARRPRDGRSCR